METIMFYISMLRAVKWLEGMQSNTGLMQEPE